MPDSKGSSSKTAQPASYLLLLRRPRTPINIQGLARTAASHQIMPSTRWVLTVDAQRPSLGLGCAGQELPACLSPSVGWLGYTTGDIQVSPCGGALLEMD